MRGRLELVNDESGNVVTAQIRYSLTRDIIVGVFALTAVAAGLYLVAQSLDPAQHFRGMRFAAILLVAGIPPLYRMIGNRVAHGGRDIVTIADRQGLNLFLYESIEIVPWSDVGSLEIWNTVNRGKVLVATLVNERRYLNQLKKDSPFWPDRPSAPPFATIGFGRSLDIDRLLEPLRALRDHVKQPGAVADGAWARPSSAMPPAVSVAPRLPTNKTDPPSPKIDEPAKVKFTAKQPQWVGVAALIASSIFVGYVFAASGGFPAVRALVDTLSGETAASSTRSRDSLKEAADFGDAYSQFLMGVRLEFGRDGHPKDIHEAVRYYTLAVDQGSYKAEYNLGLIYEHGEGGIAKDEEKAVQLYRLGKNQGDSSAATSLALMYRQGRGGLTKDEAAAIELFKDAAAAGNPIAQYYLGDAYLRGSSVVTQDLAEAARLLKLSADHGVPESQSTLAYFYYQGIGGVAQDYAEAARLYRLASDQGIADAMFGLASMYNSGIGGLPRDQTQARTLLQRAAIMGHAKARELLQQIDAPVSIKPR